MTRAGTAGVQTTGRLGQTPLRYSADRTDMAQTSQHTPSENAPAPTEPATGIRALPPEVFEYVARYLEPESGAEVRATLPGQKAVELTKDRPYCTVNACLTVCHTSHDGFVDAQYCSLRITVLGRPPCQRDPSLALAVSPPNLIANMKASQVMAERAALAQCISVYLDPGWVLHHDGCESEPRRSRLALSPSTPKGSSILDHGKGAFLAVCAARGAQSGPTSCPRHCRL